MTRAQMIAPATFAAAGALVWLAAIGDSPVSEVRSSAVPDNACAIHCPGHAAVYPRLSGFRITARGQGGSLLSILPPVCAGRLYSAGLVERPAIG